MSMRSVPVGLRSKMCAVDITLVLLSFGKSLSTVAHRAIPRDFDGHCRRFLWAEASRSVHTRREGAVGTAVDVGQRRGPRGAAQLLSTGLGNAG